MLSGCPRIRGVLAVYVGLRWEGGMAHGITGACTLAAPVALVCVELRSVQRAEYSTSS